jgi:hypothetical protein
MASCMQSGLLVLFFSLPIAAFAQNLNGHWASPPPNGNLPGTALRSGRDASGMPEVICHAFYNGGIHPGHVVQGKCHIGYGGNEVAAPKFEILMGNFADESLWSDPHLTGGGYFAGGMENGQEFRICRATLYVAGQDVPNQVGKELAGQCNIGYGGKEIQMSRYQVLYASIPQDHGSGVPVQQATLHEDAPPAERPKGGSNDPRIIDLKTMNNSGKNGDSLLEAAGPNKSRVTVRIRPQDAGATYVANIYFGVCSDFGSVAYRLNDLKNGMSTTEVPVSLPTLTGGGRPYALSVDRSGASGDPMGTSLACGELPN